MQKQLDRFTYFEKDLLGKGSFGKVYKGKDSKNGQDVAIKIMDMALFDDQFMIDALKNEISIMKQLQHEHIVRMVDVFGDNKQTVIIIELCDGGDLRKFMAHKGGMLDENTAQDVLRQLMKGFQEMTRNGYIHRDIKPENSLIHQGHHKVADFGFATKADITGRQLIRECVGTPLYMAPQLLDNKPYTAKCDIWSIGILAYEMIYGRQPWPCRDCKSYLRNMTTMPLKFPYEKQVSEQYKDFIRRCLTQDENTRVSWEQVFKHPVLVVDDKSRDYVTDKIDDKSREILHNIQKIAQARGLDVRQCFQQYDADKGGSLDAVEFFQFIQQLDPRLTSKEGDHLFKLFDKDGDAKISFDEFRHIFCDYDFSDLKDVAERIITDLKEIIKANNLNLQDIFANFDADKQGDLDMNEFTKLVQVIAPAIKPREIEQIFVKFDKNNDKRISYEEFKRELSYGTDQDSQFNPKKEKAEKVLKELRRIVKENNVNTQSIFTNFDKNNNGKLEFEEFRKLCEVVDKTLIQEEQFLVFKLVDSDNDGAILHDEFVKLFA